MYQVESSRCLHDPQKQFVIRHKRFVEHMDAEKVCDHKPQTLVRALRDEENFNHTCNAGHYDAQYRIPKPLKSSVYSIGTILSSEAPRGVQV